MALSVAVTLLGGWVTIGEAASVRVPTCDERTIDGDTAMCPSPPTQWTRCNVNPGPCVWTPKSCTSQAPFYYKLVCTGEEIIIP